MQPTYVIVPSTAQNEDNSEDENKFRSNNCYMCLALIGPFAVSLISWWIIVGLLIANKAPISSTFTFDTFLSLEIESNKSNYTSSIDVIKNFTIAYQQNYEDKKCSAPTLMTTEDSGVKWGDVAYFRYPVIIGTSENPDGRWWVSVLQDMRLLWLLFVLYTIALIMQGLYAILANTNRTQMFAKSFWRWLEYSLTTPFQILAITFLIGGFSVNELFLIFLLHPALTFLGYLVEICMEKSEKDENEKISAVIVHIFAIFLHVNLWILIFGKFADSKEVVDNLSETNCKKSHNITDVDGVPWFVDAIIYSQSIFFSFFGLVQLCQVVWVCLYNISTNVWRWGFFFYTFLNVFSKFCLAVIVITGALM